MASECLDGIYGSPEAVEQALFNKLENFPKVTTRDPQRLRNLADLLSELQAAKEDGYLAEDSGEEDKADSQEVQSTCTRVCGEGLSSRACAKICLVSVFPNEILRTQEVRLVRQEEFQTAMAANMSHLFSQMQDLLGQLARPDAARKGFKKITLRTVDTDVVVLAIAHVSELDIEELWVAFGTGKNFRYIPAHEIAKSLGPDKSKALPVFHAFTGCDTVSAFATRGKKTAWDTWNAYDMATEAFMALSKAPKSIPEEVISIVERFTILLYFRTSSQVNIDQARLELFTKKGRGMEQIPPTKEALVQHLKRAVYQGGHCWGQALEVAPNMPSPADWGSDNSTAQLLLVHFVKRNPPLPHSVMRSLAKVIASCSLDIEVLMDPGGASMVLLDCHC
ncbi:hypothetical protein N1851_009250 [Merluccius polli]|uniref:Uncharacterized protein n=1 Tax=Merluccius polli TaxID=89951 RepID=A0AA47N1J6_MERPO|nr:hypothetical protein N1851_009250 [Merluccius polli]